MKTVIISGGTGNHALINGLKNIYQDMDVEIILNAYDDGKSTGICRKVMGVLGPSDIRKNHVRLYMQSTENPDKRIIEFYGGRYDFEVGNEAVEMKKLLDKWGLSSFTKYVDLFFKQPKAKDYIYNDFNVSNIVYSAMFYEIGYEKTIEAFEELLGLDDHIILNSFDNLILKAKTQYGQVLEDEASIVDFCDKEDKIKEIYFDDRHIVANGSNPKAIHSILSADFLIISAGTFWSSIYPTLFYDDYALSKAVNESKAKKLWIMNTEEDGDSYGVSGRQFAEYMKNALNLDDFTVLLNKDASINLQMDNLGVNAIIKPMENHNGKHNAQKLAVECFKYYFNLYSDIDKYVFDFDDTIWSRLAKNDNELDSISRENIQLLKKLSLTLDITIISGNSYSSIKDKLYSEFGTSLDDFNIKIWADANAICYQNDKPIHKMLEVEKLDEVKKYLYDLDFRLEERGLSNHISCLSVKPIEGQLRTLLTKHMNYLFEKEGINNKAAETGFTTIDIVNKSNTKVSVLDYMNGQWQNKKLYYIGDEIDEGNDKDIAEKCSYKYHVSSVKETNVILRLLSL